MLSSDRADNRAMVRWRNVWLRAVLVHPIVFVAPWVVICLALGTRDGSDVNDVAWGFWVVPFAAVTSVLATGFMAARSGLRPWERVGLVLLGLWAGGWALLIGLEVWVHAAKVACHGRYECPF